MNEKLRTVSDSVEQTDSVKLHTAGSKKVHQNESNRKYPKLSENIRNYPKLT